MAARQKKAQEYQEVSANMLDLPLQDPRRLDEFKQDNESLNAVKEVLASITDKTKFMQQLHVKFFDSELKGHFFIELPKRYEIVI